MSDKTTEQIAKAVDQYTNDFARTGGDAMLDDYIDAQDVRDLVKEIESLKAIIAAIPPAGSTPQTYIASGVNMTLPQSAPKLPTILYSLDRKLYYIDQPGRLAHHWLAVEAIPGPVPDDKKDGMLDGYVQFTRGDGRVYHRRSLPFALFEVKAEREPEAVDPAGDLYLDYVAFEWPNMEPPSTEMFTVVVHGTPRSVEGPSTALVGDFMTQLLAKYEPGEKIDFWELRDEAGVLLMKYQPLGRRGGQTLFLNLRAGVGA